MMQDTMKTTSHTVNLRYERHELHALFDVASAEDVEKGGRYDARGGAIHVWSHHWRHPATREESEMLGSFYVNWMEETIQRIACDAGFTLDDLLHELALLERKALGRVKHGLEAKR
jgi:hypothetical protein